MQLTFCLILFVYTKRLLNEQKREEEPIQIDFIPYVIDNKICKGYFKDVSAERMLIVNI